MVLAVSVMTVIVQFSEAILTATALCLSRSMTTTTLLMCTITYNIVYVYVNDYFWYLKEKIQKKR